MTVQGICCGPYGRQIPASSLCDCYAGHAGPNPERNCFVPYEGTSTVWFLQSLDPCNTTCDWSEGGDISANYPCVTEGHKDCNC